MMISVSRLAGEVCKTLYTVLRRVDQASLWNTMITLVVGNAGHRRNLCSTHLDNNYLDTFNESIVAFIINVVECFTSN